MHRYSPISNIDLAMRYLLPGQGVLHPLLVIAVGVIFTSVSATRFFTVRGGFGGLYTVIMSINFSVYLRFEWRGDKLTRRSRGFEAPGSQRDQNSKSYFCPWYPRRHTFDLPP